MLNNNSKDHKRKKAYAKPEIEVIVFETERICVSGAEDLGSDPYSY